MMFYLLFHLFFTKSKTLIVQWFFKSLFVFKFLAHEIIYTSDFLPKSWLEEFLFYLPAQLPILL
jgi:hypothetical protein